MKRTVTAWIMLMVLVLGAVPAMAAGPIRDVIDLPVATADPEVTAGPDDAEPSPDASPSPSPETEEATPSPSPETEEATPSPSPEAEEASPSPSPADTVFNEGMPSEMIVSVSGNSIVDGTTQSTQSQGRNTAPVAENQELETYRGVSLGGQLTAYDADGDALIFEIATEPMKGTVQLAADGCFVYTPKEGKRGKDYFGFRAIDTAGNVSQEGTVIIRLVKQKSKVTYSDMTGNGSEYAAIVLTENGVFTGEYVGTDYVFNPEDTVTRGEFLSMCMNAAGCNLLKGVNTTGFADDSSINAWLKPYVATALMNGYIQGSSFDPDSTVSLQEACVTLNAVLGVTDVVSAAAYVGEDNSGASWAQAVANLTACGVMPSYWDDVEVVLTRAGAAELISNAIGLLSGR